MKKLMLALSLLSGLNSLSAQTTTPENVPDPVKTSFNKKYPNAVPNWNLDAGNYEAEYYDQNNNLGRTVVYDKNGTIIRTDYELGAGDFPATIGDYYSQNYPDQSYRVWSSEDVNGNRIYYGKQKDQIAWFDKDGKYIPEKPVKTNPDKKKRKK